jgi:hypothetical protein
MNPAFLDLVVAIVWSSEGARSITTTTMTTNVMMSYATNRMNDRLMMNVMTTDSKKNGRRNRTSELAARRLNFVGDDQRSSVLNDLSEVVFSGIACAGSPKTRAS